MARAALVALMLLLGLLVLGIIHPAPDSALFVVRGEVRDSEGPVDGARVRFKARTGSVTTDHAGRFSLAGMRDDYRRITAWKAGHFIAGVRADRRPSTLNLVGLPPEDCETYSWIDPRPDPNSSSNCANCHAQIYEEWAGGAHAGAATNRHFLGMYDGSDWSGRKGRGWSLRDEYPDGVGVCTACHAPTVPHGDPAYFDLTQVQGVARQGVHCDYCHKIADAGLGTIGLTHGRFGLELLRPAKGQLFFGPLDDVDRAEDAYSPLYRDSRYCASCHEGIVFGVHVYGTYSEWLDSPARREGKHCQNCHMKPTGHMTNIAPGRGGVKRDPHTLGNHHFFAGSQLDMLRRALKVSVRTRREMGAWQVQLELRADGVGHRAPTGFVDRHLVLIVEPFDARGKRLLASSGPALPRSAGLELAGLPGRLYGRILTDNQGHSPVPFWRADDSRTQDTRLIPGKTENLTWRIAGDVDHVRVRFLHRRTWEEAAREKEWPDNELVILDQTYPQR